MSLENGIATLLLMAFAAAGCEPGEAREVSAARSAAIAASAAAVETRWYSPAADTAVSEETLRAMVEFAAAVSGPLPDRLTAGAPSMDALVARFVAAVEAADTAALIRMTMTRGEFIALHYPESIYVRPPYELLPDDVWLVARAETEKGLTRLLRRFGGQAFGFTGYDCPEPPRREGPNRWWSGCTITRSVAGAPLAMRYFATIWERNGAFKFGSYANDL